MLDPGEKLKKNVSMRRFAIDNSLNKDNCRFVDDHDILEVFENMLTLITKSVITQSRYDNYQ